MLKISFHFINLVSQMQACDQLETKKKENMTTPQATPTSHTPQHLLKIYILAH